MRQDVLSYLYVVTPLFMKKKLKGIIQIVWYYRGILFHFLISWLGQIPSVHISSTWPDLLL